MEDLEKSVAEETIQDLQERIRFLEQCLDNKEKVNKSLREEISKITMVADDEKQSIEHILELEEENKRLLEKNKIYSNALVQEKEEKKSLQEYYIIACEKVYKLEEENKKLKEERDFFKEQAMLWRKDYTNEYEKNRNLIGKLESLEK